MKKLVIFDLDGTLLNTIADLGTATNHALRQMGFPEHAPEQYPFMVGNGITKLIERALPADLRDEATITRAREIFLEFYGEHCMDLSTPYPGIPELLRELTAKGVKVAVASNKYKAGVVKLINHFFPGIPWLAIEGQIAGRPTKPDPTIVYDILDMTGIAKDDVLYVGDSGVDMDTARNAGLESIGVTWGFRPRTELEEHHACHIIDHPSLLLNYL